MGGMAAHIPNKNDSVVTSEALKAVENDKLREVKAGHDGTWVAHPGLVPLARSVFDKYMPGENQLAVKRKEVEIKESDLLSTEFSGSVTSKGLQNNVDAALQYTASWLAGVGCVPINNLMEDAATAEIARTQLWQWVHYRATTAEGLEV